MTTDLKRFVVGLVVSALALKAFDASKPALLWCCDHLAARLDGPDRLLVDVMAAETALERERREVWWGPCNDERVLAFRAELRETPGVPEGWWYAGA